MAILIICIVVAVIIVVRIKHKNESSQPDCSSYPSENIRTTADTTAIDAFIEKLFSVENKAILIVEGRQDTVTSTLLIGEEGNAQECVTVSESIDKKGTLIADALSLGFTICRCYNITVSEYAEEELLLTIYFLSQQSNPEPFGIDFLTHYIRAEMIYHSCDKYVVNKNQLILKAFRREKGNEKIEDGDGLFFSEAYNFKEAKKGEMQSLYCLHLLENNSHACWDEVEQSYRSIIERVKKAKATSEGQNSKVTTDYLLRIYEEAYNLLKQRKNAEQVRFDD